MTIRYFICISDANPKLKSQNYYKSLGGFQLYSPPSPVPLSASRQTVAVSMIILQNHVTHTASVIVPLYNNMVTMGCAAVPAMPKPILTVHEQK